jgi:putative transposase
MRQEIIDRVQDNIRGLASLKNKGYKIGSLKFKSRVLSIPLKQYGKTHEVIQNRIRIQSLSQRLKVRGLDQIPDYAEPGSATLLFKGGGYYIHLTTFQPKLPREYPSSKIGIDFGIENQLTLSNGLDIKEHVFPTRKIAQIHRRLSRRKRLGRNWQKTRERLDRECNKIKNQKSDTRNKIVGKIVSSYETIKLQDDDIHSWQTMWGRKIQASAIGGITSALKNKAHTLVEVPRFTPTTKTCCSCRNIQTVELKERIYLCTKCGLRIDRDLNSAINILNYGVPAERREFTPVDTAASIGMMEYLNSIPRVSASLVEETGSLEQ